MYTYEPFENLGVFTLLRPTFITILTVSLFIFFMIIIPKFNNKMINGFTVLSLSAISILVAAQLLFYEGFFVDEIGLGGDSVSFYLFLAIAGMGIINLTLYFSKKEGLKQPPN
ncbi:hypothetical protein ACWM35_14350 [Neobacillus sp. K501]